MPLKIARPSRRRRPAPDTATQASPVADTAPMGPADPPAADSAPGPTSWAPEVKVDGEWSRNGLRFATQGEAEGNARALLMRWYVPTDSRATPSTDPVNYRWTDDGDLVAV